MLKLFHQIFSNYFTNPFSQCVENLTFAMGGRILIGMRQHRPSKDVTKTSGEHSEDVLRPKDVSRTFPRHPLEICAI